MQLEIDGLFLLKRLELGFCVNRQTIKIVEIDAPNLEKLLLSENGIPFSLKINEKTCELTVLDSTCSGKNFSRMFRGCPKLEPLVLRRCPKKCKIALSIQKIKRLVIDACHSLVITDTEAPKLSSMKFINNGCPLYFVETGKLQY